MTPEQRQKAEQRINWQIKEDELARARIASWMTERERRQPGTLTFTISNSFLTNIVCVDTS